MIRKNQEEKRIENEERFKFVQYKDNKNQNLQALNKADTLQYFAEQVLILLNLQFSCFYFKYTL